jgi:ribonuclease HII
MMLALAEEYPGYAFEIHKGYGTKAHYEALRNLGPSSIHRMSFLKKFYGNC